MSPVSDKDRQVREALDHYEKPLVHYAIRLLGDVERARDVVQETFLQLWKTRLGDLTNLSSWLFTVCRNRALDLLRKESRLMPLEQTQHVATLPNPGPLPSTLLEARETTALVLKSIAALPPNQREVMHLKFKEGMSYKEISKITRLSVSNVGFLIHTAVKTLRQTLAESQVH